MQSTHQLITRTSVIEETPRVLQVRGMFDLEPQEKETLTWNVHLPLEEKPWNIGLIVGPSGCGKSTIAASLFPQEMAASSAVSWPASSAVVDGFPESLSIKDVTGLLSAVGFSSPPACSWSEARPIFY